MTTQMEQDFAELDFTILRVYAEMEQALTELKWLSGGDDCIKPDYILQEST